MRWSALPMEVGSRRSSVAASRRGLPVAAAETTTDPEQSAATLACGSWADRSQAIADAGQIIAGATGVARPVPLVDASNTGVPAGTTFTRHHAGMLTITTDNTVVDGWEVTGNIVVKAKNVTIQNCKVNFNGWWGIDAEGAKNITIQDCVIVGPGYSGDSNAAILGSGTFLRNDISKVENGIVLTGRCKHREGQLHPRP